MIGFLIPLSIAMGLAGLAAFVWALRHGQFNDPRGDACRILIPQPPQQSPLKGKPDVRLVDDADHTDPRRRL